MAGSAQSAEKHTQLGDFVMDDVKDLLASFYDGNIVHTPFTARISVS